MDGRDHILRETSSKCWKLYRYMHGARKEVYIGALTFDGQHWRLTTGLAEYLDGRTFSTVQLKNAKHALRIMVRDTFGDDSFIWHETLPAFAREDRKHV